MTATTIETRGCGRTFADGTIGLQPTDLTVNAGETLVLLGPSGCGKTTLLRIMSGLARPDDGGSVWFDGTDVTDLPIERRDVGMVFQSYALFPNMTVAGNVAYGPKLKGLGRRARREKAAQYLALCRIEALANRRIDQLSGGQRQRVALARALAAEPRAIFLDEPLTALDAALRETLRDEIGGVLAGLGTTAVYVTHDQTEAMALADRIVVMREGQIAQVGEPREVYQHPASRFVAEFVGKTNKALLPTGEVALMRPEAIDLVAPGGGLNGTVVAVTYLGEVTHVTVDTEHGPWLVPDRTGRPFNAGDPVGLAFNPDKAMRFPASEG